MCNQLRRVLNGLLLALALINFASGVAHSQVDDAVVKQQEAKATKDAERPVNCAAHKVATGIASDLLGAVTDIAVSDVESIAAAETEEMSSNARILAQNLKKAGKIRPPNSAAHHIVAGNSPRAAEARAILKAEGIQINEASNGVFLPKNSKVPNPGCSSVHSRLHTNVYYDAVNAALRNAAKGTVRDVLRDIAKQILSDTFTY
jgi:hypothetical protein